MIAWLLIVGLAHAQPRLRRRPAEAWEPSVLDWYAWCIDEVLAYRTRLRR